MNAGCHRTGLRDSTSAHGRAVDPEPRIGHMLPGCRASSPAGSHSSTTTHAPSSWTACATRPRQSPSTRRHSSRQSGAPPTVGVSDPAMSEGYHRVAVLVAAAGDCPHGRRHEPTERLRQHGRPRLPKGGASRAPVVLAPALPTIRTDERAPPICQGLPSSQPTTSRRRVDVVVAAMGLRASLNKIVAAGRSRIVPAPPFRSAAGRSSRFP